LDLAQSNHGHLGVYETMTVNRPVILSIDILVDKCHLSGRGSKHSNYIDLTQPDQLAAASFQ